MLLALVLALAAGPVASQTSDLTGAWVDENGLVTCIRQVGNRVCWHLDDRPRVHNVFCGVVAGTTHWLKLTGKRGTDTRCQ